MLANMWKNTIKALEKAGFEVKFDDDLGKDCDAANECWDNMKKAKAEAIKKSDDILDKKKKYWAELATMIRDCDDKKDKKVLESAQSTLSAICAGPAVIIQNK